MIRQVVAALAAVLTAGPAIAADVPTVAKAFCAAQIAGDEAAIRRLLTPSLAALIAEAEARNATIAAGAPDEKPPLADGVPFQAFPDRAPECAIGAIRSADNQSLVQISYSFPNVSGGNWSDRLVITPADGNYLIDDILFQSFPTDTYAAGLRRFLTESFDLSQ